jgi:hypothetical protein
LMAERQKKYCMVAKIPAHSVGSSQGLNFGPSAPEAGIIPLPRPTGHDDAVLIGLGPRMFCARSKNHTSRPTGHDDAICAVLEARREFLLIIHVMQHQTSTKSQKSSSKKSEFKRKLGALNQIRTTDVLHPKQGSYL